MTGHTKRIQLTDCQNIVSIVLPFVQGKAGYASLWVMPSNLVDGRLEAPCHVPVVGEVPL